MISKASSYRWILVPAMALQVWSLQGCATNTGPTGSNAQSASANTAQTNGSVDSVASADAVVTSLINSNDIQAVLAAAVGDANCLADASQVGNIMLPFVPGCMNANNLNDPNGMFSQHGFFGSAGPFNGNAIDGNWVVNANVLFSGNANVYAHFPNGFDPNLFTGFDPNHIPAFAGLDPNGMFGRTFDANHVVIDANQIFAGLDPNAFQGFDPNKIFAPQGSFDPNAFTQFMGGLNNALGALRSCIDPNGAALKAP